ncbi:MAG: hypothetical protein Q4B42_07505, partial [Oscillospiraceae bacterium]|nr:hypothetical protein [Oscillospiraceae bacterium]
DAFRKSAPFSGCLAEDYSEGLRGLPPAELIKYTLADGSTLAVRPSGTEPILKVYYSARGADKNAADSRLEKLKTALRRYLK